MKRTYNKVGIRNYGVVLDLDVRTIFTANNVRIPCNDQCPDFEVCKIKKDLCPVVDNGVRNILWSMERDFKTVKFTEFQLNRIGNELIQLYALKFYPSNDPKYITDLEVKIQNTWKSILKHEAPSEVDLAHKELEKTKKKIAEEKELLMTKKDKEALMAEIEADKPLPTDKVPLYFWQLPYDARHIYSYSDYRDSKNYWHEIFEKIITDVMIFLYKTDPIVYENFVIKDGKKTKINYKLRKAMEQAAWELARIDYERYRPMMDKRIVFDDKNKTRVVDQWEQIS